MTSLATLKKHLDGIPQRRMPLGKNTWLQEWNEIKELVEAFEKELHAELKANQKHADDIGLSEVNRAWFSGVCTGIEDVLGDKEKAK